jgi:hypothetical protein
VSDRSAVDFIKSYQVAVLSQDSRAAGARVRLPSLALEPDGWTDGVAGVASETSNANNPPADRLPVGDDSG